MVQFLAMAFVLLVEPQGQVLGFYSNGRLHDATPLTREGRGFVHLFQHRARGFGSAGLVTIIHEVSGAMAEQFPGGERLQVGDLSQEKGGQITRHASHQNGLDADIVYFRVDRREQRDEPQTNDFEESFVKNGKVTANFDFERNWALMRAFVATGRTQRVFVDRAIKAAFCDYARKIGEFESGAEILRRMRPYPNHDDHLHLRLTCPAATSPKCLPQEELPAGTGCPNDQPPAR